MLESHQLLTKFRDDGPNVFFCLLKYSSPFVSQFQLTLTLRPSQEMLSTSADVEATSQEKTSQAQSEEDEEALI